MIAKLSITNFLLIEQLELNLHPGLNIITGETGAGKSIIMDALSLLAGERADPKSIRHPEKKCCIEAWFSGAGEAVKDAFAASGLEAEEENILRRELLPGGKSRAFINDSPVTLEVMRPLALLLFDIHGQQDSLLLGNPDRQFQVLDVLAGTGALFASYRRAYRQWKEISRRLDELKTAALRSAAELDYKSFLHKELEEAGLREGEQEELESRLAVMQHAGDILSRLQQVSDALDGRQDILGSLRGLSSQLAKVSSFSPRLGALAERLNSAYLELKDLASEARDLEAGLEIDPGRMQADEERLSRLYALQKKHRLSTVEELIQLREELDVSLQQFGRQENEQEALENELVLSLAEVNRLAEALQQERLAAVAAITGELQSLLAEMAMPRARFSIELEELNQPSPFGKSGIRFFFSANPGLPLSELKNAASGGEFSRLMLAFKCLMAAKAEMPSLIFDEIDTGISGEVAMRVGRLIRQMAERHQVLVITHSAQMASRAQAHWKVEKSQDHQATETRVRLLSPEESVQEIASMISGSEPGKAALEAARELINH